VNTDQDGLTRGERLALRSRRAQGLPDHIEDDAVLRRIAEMFATAEAHSDARREREQR
jgi:hypothetical protein